MKKYLSLIIFCFMAVASFSPNVLAQESQQKALELLNPFVEALLIPDATASAQALLPLLHSSLKSSDGKSLTSLVEQFSFQKARKDVGFYKSPVEIARENKLNQSSINLGSAPETGALVDYYIARKDPKTGLPAPVRIFFPADGSKAVITYIGNL